MKKKHLIIPALALTAFLTNCEKHDHDQAGDHGHDHGGETAEAHGHDHADGGHHHDHDHGDEAPLGKFMIGDYEVEAAQSHGNVEAGKEGHLVIKLPYNDNGATVVRAWIGNEDRTLSTVGRGEYAADHDDYDIHAMAPNPLPEDTKWWVELEKTDGTKLLGSIAPKM
ncbi:MAG: hypothetical protein ACNA8L_02705 [Luteolibacter sp.]